MDPSFGLRSKPVGLLRACRTLLVTATLVLLIGIPAVSAEPGSFDRAEVYLTPERFTAILYGESHEGDAAADFRARIDRNHGDDDGNVTQDEVDAYRQATRQELNAKLDNPFAKGLVAKIQVNERPPMQVRVTDVQVSENVLGPTTDNPTVLRDIHALITYASTSRDRANVTFAQDFRQAFIGMDWGYATFQGHGDWAIDGETIDPDGTDNPYWTGDGFNVTYDEMDHFSSGFEPLHFQLYNATAVPAEEEKKKKSPGVGVLVLLLVVAGIVAAARARRFG